MSASANRDRRASAELREVRTATEVARELLGDVVLPQADRLAAAAEGLGDHLQEGTSRSTRNERELGPGGRRGGA